MILVRGLPNGDIQKMKSKTQHIYLPLFPPKKEESEKQVNMNSIHESGFFPGKGEML